MAHDLQDATGDTTSTTGTSDFVIDGVALTGCVSFASALTNGLTYGYRCETSDKTSWEVGSGTWTSATSTLTRTTVSRSSNGNAKVSFASGAKSIGIVIQAQDFAAFGALGSANTWTAANIFSDQSVSRAMLIDCGLVFVDKGNSGTSTQTLDYTAGSAQAVTCTGNFTLATSNWPPTGNLGAILLKAVNFGANTVTWPTVNWFKPDGSTTTSVATWLAAETGRTAFQTSGTEFIKLWTLDAGTTIYGAFAA
jgi:hypothetical protein